MQRAMNRLFDGYAHGAEPFPAVNVWANRDEAVLTAEVPGMEPGGIDIAVQGGDVTLRGQRGAAEPAEDCACHRCERWTGAFARTVRLPFEVQADKVSAKYRNGVLTVTLPRAESAKPRRIAIAAE